MKVKALARSVVRGGERRTYQELPDRWSEGLAELTGHLVGDGWLTDVQTGWVYGGDDIDDGLLDAHEGLLQRADRRDLAARRCPTGPCSCGPAAAPYESCSAASA